MDNVEYITKNIVDSYLISFGLESQFLELKFSSNNFDKIIINLDCNLETSDFSYNKQVESFKKHCKYAYVVAYFIVVNLQKVVGCEISKSLDLVVLKFENGIDILFDISEYSADFAITFWDKSNPKLYDGFSISLEGIERSSPLG
jgi:hypothetical protein